MTGGPAYYLGVDGGGTRTVARLLAFDDAASAGCVLGSGEAPGSNPHSVGWDATHARIAQAIGDCLAQAGLTAPVRGAALAIAGCADGPTRDQLSAWAAGTDFAERVDVVPDTAPLLAAAAPDEAAVGLIAGTGSAAIARSSDGAVTTVGGWGYLIDDAGSGFALGRAALQAVTRAASGIAPAEDDAPRLVVLREEVLRSAGVERVDVLKRTVYQAADPRATIAGFAPLVLRLAAEDDAPAVAIADNGAAELARLVRAAVGVVGEGAPTVYLTGSLLLRSAWYRHRFETHCRRLGVRSPIRLAPDGACGCAWLARRFASA